MENSPILMGLIEQVQHLTRTDNLLAIHEKEALVISKPIVLLLIVTERIQNVLVILQMKELLFYLL